MPPSGGVMAVDLGLLGHEHGGEGPGPVAGEGRHQAPGLVEGLEEPGDDLHLLVGVGHHQVGAEDEGHHRGQQPVLAAHGHGLGRRHEALGIDVDLAVQAGGDEAARRLREDAAVGPVQDEMMVVVVVGVGGDDVLGQGVAAQADAGLPSVVVALGDDGAVLDAHRNVGPDLLDGGAQLRVHRLPVVEPRLQPGVPQGVAPVARGGRLVARGLAELRPAEVAVAADGAVAEAEGGLVVEVDLDQRRPAADLHELVQVPGLVLRPEGAQPPHPQPVEVLHRAVAGQVHEPPGLRRHQGLLVLHVAGEGDVAEAALRAHPGQPLPLLQGEAVVALGQLHQAGAHVGEPLLHDPVEGLLVEGHPREAEQRCAPESPLLGHGYRTSFSAAASDSSTMSSRPSSSWRVIVRGG